MAELNASFETFLTNIRPTPNQRQDMASGHKTLRARLQAFKNLQPILVSDFLQGSYRRATAIRPHAEKRSDVDVVVVTNLDSTKHTPRQALDRFVPFLEEHYPGKWEPQGRSFAIHLSYVDLDLVVTAAPSEVDRQALVSAAARSLDTPEDVTDWRFNALWLPRGERNVIGATDLLLRAAAAPEWKTQPLLIPNREAHRWEPTHPLAQIAWTFGKNRATNRRYVNVVKTLKWWRRVRYPEPERPKGYPLEHIVGDCCPDGIATVAEGVCRTLEAIRDRFATHAAVRLTPELADRGTSQNVLARITGGDFADFHGQAATDAALARKAYDEPDQAKSAVLWQKLLGSEFPLSTSEGSGGSPSGSRRAFSMPSVPAVPPRGRFA
jgi:hypothetical protein